MISCSLFKQRLRYLSINTKLCPAKSLCDISQFLKETEFMPQTHFLILINLQTKNSDFQIAIYIQHDGVNL